MTKPLPAPDLSLAVWGVRDLLRRPLQTTLLCAAMTALTFLTALPLLTAQGLRHTAAVMLGDAPSLIVRKTSPAGWVPIPVDAAPEIARSVPGITRAAARLWGTARFGDQVVTVQGEPSPSDGQPPLSAGTARVGSGILVPDGGELVLQNGRQTVRVAALERFPASTAALTANTVVLHPADARTLLRIPEGMATDLSLHVFHAEEIPALLPDLTAAFPWPVQTETVTAARGRYAGAFSLRAGIAMVMLIPALLALALLTVSAPVRFSGRAHEVGLLKALGWGTGDVVRFHLTRAGLAALPAVGSGLLLALTAPALPRFHLLGRLLLGIGSRPPALFLTPGERAAVCGITALFVLLPYLLATLWSALHSATADPLDLLEGG